MSVLSFTKRCKYLVCVSIIEAFLRFIRFHDLMTCSLPDEGDCSVTFAILNLIDATDGENISLKEKIFLFFGFVKICLRYVK
jgi:hypothetical protein